MREAKPITITEAATYIQDRVMQSWRFRLGRNREDLLNQVDGVSFTWSTQPNGTWSFTFLLRRNTKWKKESTTIDPKRIDVEESDRTADIWEQMLEAPSYLIESAVLSLFPEVKDDDKRERAYREAKERGEDPDECE